MRAGRAAILLATVVFSVVTCFAQEERCAPFCDVHQPTAEQLFERGTEAAKRQDFPSAARYFDRAQRADPGNMDAIFNLALAESRIPGAELLAVAWFEAYLDANPDTPKKAIIRRQNAALTLHALQNLQRMADSVERLASQSTSPPDRMLAMKYAATIKADAVDVDGARKAAEALDADVKASALSWIDSIYSDYRRSHCDTFLYLAGSTESLSAPEAFQPADWTPEFRKDRIKRWTRFIDSEFSDMPADLPAYLSNLAKGEKTLDAIEGVAAVAQNTRISLTHVQQFLMNEAMASSSLAKEYETKGETAKAVQYYDRAVQLCPNYSTLWGEGAESFSKRGWELLRDGQTDLAIEDFGQCIRRANRCAQGYKPDCEAPKDSECLFAQGAAYFVKGQFENALKDFHLAKKSPQSDAWGYIAGSRAGLHPTAEDSFGSENSDGRVLVKALFQGKMTPGVFISRYESDSRSPCNKYLYAGENALLLHKFEAAQTYFLKELERTSECGDTPAYIGARAELRRTLASSLAETKPNPVAKQNNVGVFAPVAGTIAEVLVKQDARVRQGQVLATIATYPDRTPIVAPVDGIVTSVLIAPGMVVVPKSNKQAFWKGLVIIKRDEQQEK